MSIIGDLQKAGIEITQDGKLNFKYSGLELDGTPISNLLVQSAIASLTNSTGDVTQSGITAEVAATGTGLANNDDVATVVPTKEDVDARLATINSNLANLTILVNAILVALRDATVIES